MMSLVTTKIKRYIALALLLYFQHSTAVSLNIIPGAQTTLNNENNGTILQAGNSTKTESNSERDLTKQGLQCYALRCYGHFVNIHRCCPGFHCSIHIPLIGGICIRDPETNPPSPSNYQNVPENEPEKPAVVPESEGEVASAYPSFEVIPPKEESSPAPTISNQQGFIPTIPSYADWAYFP